MSLIERISTSIQRNKIQNTVSKLQSESGLELELESKLEIKPKSGVESKLGSGSGSGSGSELELKSGIKSDLNLNLNLNIEPSEPLDFLFIDADSKDPSLGLSAPPQTFITHTALRTFYQGTVQYNMSFFVLSTLSCLVLSCLQYDIMLY